MTVANSTWTRYLGYLRRLSAGHLSERRPRTTRLQRMRNSLTFRTCKVPSTSGIVGERKRVESQLVFAFDAGAIVLA